ncbi:MAG: low molecular weight phosphatase family protein [Actinomycetota bacterium]
MVAFRGRSRHGHPSQLTVTVQESRNHGESSKVLIVCGGNTCRSPMAAAMLTELLDSAAHIESAGVDADEGRPAQPNAISVMAERGLDISAHVSRDMDSVGTKKFDVVIAMEPAVAHRLESYQLEASRIEVLNIEDPFGRRIQHMKSILELARGVRGRASPKLKE